LRHNWEFATHTYSHAQFMKKVTPDEVDFSVPRRPDWIVLANVPEFFMRLRLRWIGRQIPREDAKWMGRLLQTRTTSSVKCWSGECRST
jgi:hypothetical protein